MDSEDDMHDANDMESVDEDFYSDGDGYGGDAVDSDGDVADYDFMGNETDDSDEQIVSRSQVLKLISTSVSWSRTSWGSVKWIFSGLLHFTAY